MRTLIQSDNAAETSIRAQAAKVIGVKDDLAIQRAQMTKQFRTILTDKLIKKSKAIKKGK